jgi:hypothetical protein
MDHLIYLERTAFSALCSSCCGRGAGKEQPNKKNDLSFG